MRTRRPMGARGVLLAGSCLLVLSGCAGIFNPANPNTPAGNDANLIGNNSASIIANNSASLTNRGLSGLSSGLNDVTVTKSSKLIGNNSASLIGNNSASLIGNNSASLIGNNSASLIANNSSALIGNNSASLIGNNSASYRVATVDGRLEYADSGAWDSIQVDVPLAGEITARVDGQLVEDYAYHYTARQLAGGQAVSYRRTETVSASKLRALGDYVFDGSLNLDTGVFNTSVDFTPAGSSTANHLVIQRRGTSSGGQDVVTTAVDGTTSLGVVVSLASTSSVDTSASTNQFTEKGTVILPNGEHFAVSATLQSSGSGQNLPTTGSIVLRALDTDGTASQSFTLDFTHSSDGSETIDAKLLDRAGQTLATVQPLYSLGVLRATFSSNATADLRLDSVRQILAIASQH